MSETLLETPLHGWHVANGGRMVPFGGWSMPVQYLGIVAEHLATRTACGLFDISHMGRLRFQGPDAGKFLNRLVTKDVSKLTPGRIRYALVTNETGGILDDVLVYHLRDGAGEPYYLLVVNASNRLKIKSWIETQLLARPLENLQWADLTTTWAMIAVQGPLALELLKPLVEADLPRMKYYSGTETRILGHGGIVSRTGYTGEDGCELIVGAHVAQAVWEAVLSAGQARGAMAAGLGARDTLRLEAAMPLYGHELSEQINPYQAGLGFAVDLDKDESFPGRSALAQLKADATLPVRVGLELEGRRIAREHAAIAVDAASFATPLGELTSGTLGPTVEKVIAMGYVPAAYAAVGTSLAVDVRGKPAAARVVPLPFYQRAKS